MIPTKKRIDYFSDLYETARQAASAELDSYARRRTQYRTGRVSDGGKKTPVIRNITYELIESEISTDIPVPKVTPMNRDRHHSRNAVAVEQLCRNVRERLAFERMNDIDERYTYVLGGSVWVCEWDGEASTPIISCISPENFIPEPNVIEVENMEYCFIVTAKSAAEVEKTYGVRIPSDEYLELPTVVICYWKNDAGEVCRYIFSGKHELSDVENYYARRDVEGNIIKGELIKDGKGERLVPYYLPKRLPVVIRKNVSKEFSLVGQSDCDVIVSQQDAINRIESRIYQKLVRSAVIPYMPDDCRVIPTNSVFGEVIHIDPADTEARFGVIDTTPVIAQDVAESDRLYDHARKMLGITNSYTGENENGALSGYAMSLKLTQSASRLKSKRVMKNALYADLDAMIFGLYLAFCDDVIPLGYTDVYGASHGISFSRHDFICYDEASGGYIYDDGYMFSAARSIGFEGQDLDALRDATLSYYREGLFGDPSTAAARRLCWTRLEALGYPDAHSIAAVFESGGTDILEGEG